MSKVLEIKEVSKKFSRRIVLNNVNLSLDKGKVLGILGPNGQGKTTLLNTIFGFLRPDNGEVKINGINVGYETKKSVAFLQEKNNLRSWMSVKDAIEFYRDFFEDFDENRLNELLEFMEVSKESKVKSLSKGTLEKLCLSLVLSRRAKLYILDEPISGVDLIAREKIVEAIVKNISDDSSMIITTHYVGELERVFDEVAFITEGKIVEHGDAEDLREKYNGSIEDIYRKLFGV